MQLPSQLINSLAGIKGFDREAFENVHASGEQVTSIRINPSKWAEGEATHHSPFTIHHSVPWTQYGYYLEERPSFTFDPLFHAGCYYVQEASSMFLEQALQQTTDLSQPLKILDLSAAPGGKSTHIQSLITPDSLLVSNEVIRSRAAVLKDNIIKWGCSNVMVTHNDPRDFAQLNGYFDVIVVDAPCSGSGLFRRDPEAISEWSENNVELCARRQQRILADVWPALKKDGILIYSTCSYSRQEDEAILDWLTEQGTGNSRRLTLSPEWNITEVQGNSGTYGYRFWPDKVKGEGFFIACFRKAAEEEPVNLKIKDRPVPVTKKEQDITGKWIKENDARLIKHQQTVYAWPASLFTDLSFLLNQLHVIYSGTIIGDLLRDKLVPHHALAMSNLVNDSIGRVALDQEQAIQYLKRKDIAVPVKQTGWQLVAYEEHSLGWINALPNRINNYYPKELRILKDN